jgi:hypothetical protein
MTFECLDVVGGRRRRNAIESDGQCERHMSASLIALIFVFAPAGCAKSNQSSEPTPSSVTVAASSAEGSNRRVTNRFGHAWLSD